MSDAWRVTPFTSTLQVKEHYVPRLLYALFAVAGVLLALSFLRPRPVQAVAVSETSAIIPVPSNYREWVYLTSGLDMTYSQPRAAPVPENHVSVFDNVFVNPEAYRTLVQTASWPDNTTFVLENRSGERNVSINKAGRTQGTDVTGIELHAKIRGEWTFYERENDGSERLIPRPASCYTCHEQHAAVDTTFIQFYPTLLPIAKAKHVLSAGYLAEQAATTGK